MLKEVKLDARQQARWDETRAAMTVAAPHFTHLLYTLLDHRTNKAHAYFTNDIPTAATDAKVILLNPLTYLPRPLAQRVFILGHELLHNVFNDIVLLHHCAMTGRVITTKGNSLPFAPKLLQIAMDLRINDCLVESKLGEMPPDGWLDPNLGTRHDPVTVIYERLFKQCTSGGGGKGKGKGKPGEGGTEIEIFGLNPGEEGHGKGANGDSFDQLLKPGESGVGGQTASEAAQERENAQDTWDREIQAAAAMSRAQGRLPAALEHVFGEITTHVVPWQEHLQAELARSFGGGSYNWKRPDRSFIVRDIYVPGRSSYACDLIVVACDTSGSITDEEIDRSLSETVGILEELRPQKIVLIWCDAAIGRVDELTDLDDMRAIREKGAPGRGGTSFIPVFEYIAHEGLNPDALIYFTDGYGSFPPSEPEYTTIWGQLLPNQPVAFPFGKVVSIPRSA